MTNSLTLGGGPDLRHQDFHGGSTIDINTDYGYRRAMDPEGPWAASQAKVSPWHWVAVQDTQIYMAKAVT